MQSNTDLEKWHKAIAGIEAKQNELSSEELSALAALKMLYENGNFEASESGGSIKTIKDGLVKHSNNRLLSAHLKNFVALCEQNFSLAPKTIPPIVTPPTIQPAIVEPVISPPRPLVVQPPVITQNSPIIVSPPTTTQLPKSNGSNKKMILIIIVAIALIGSWQAYKNRDTVIKPLLEDLGLIHKIIPVTSITLDKSELQLMAGDTVRITATVIPDNPNNKSVTWLSYNSNVATVDTTGLVTAIAQGKTGIAAFYSDSILDTCIVSVQQQPNLYVIATKTYSFGKYTGRLKNGIPEGDGKMIYNRRVQIAKHDTDNPPHYAEAGDYFDGSWGNGDIVSGYLYGRNGSIKERILAPKRFNPYDISKD